MNKKILILITATLRDEYNELFLNLNEDDIVFPLFIYNNNYISKMSPIRKEFIFQGVENFKRNLQKKYNLYLHTQLGEPQTILEKYLNDYKFDEIRTEFQYSSDELDINSFLHDYCNNSSISYKQYNTQTIFNIQQLPFSSVKEIPNTYTTFRKIVEKHNCYDVKISSISIPTFTFNPIDCNFVSRINLGLEEEKITLRYTPSRKIALQHLYEYIWKEQNILTYKETQNEMLGEHFSTKFSVYLNFGILSVQEILFEINRFEKEVKSNSSTYWVKFELLLREYCKWISLKFKNKVFSTTGITNSKIYSNFNQEYYDSFILGNTGYPLVDAGVRELIQTGYMSNRARQNVASFFIKNLHLPWILGAEFFEKHLLDYDPCSNYLNWQYIAGCGTDSREFRYFNIYKQTNDYDKDKNYISNWVPELNSSSYTKEIVDFYTSINIAKKEQEKLNTKKKK
ncbi:MAG: DASH family cryptochrome [Nanoarchaeota archaeon]|nr:DASH family cryptochrome [Nanoarchaeota archaeon]